MSRAEEDALIANAVAEFSARGLRVHAGKSSVSAAAEAIEPSHPEHVRGKPCQLCTDELARVLAIAQGLSQAGEAFNPPPAITKELRRCTAKAHELVCHDVEPWPYPLHLSSGLDALAEQTITRAGKGLSVDWQALTEFAEDLLRRVSRYRRKHFGAAGEEVGGG